MGLKLEIVGKLYYRLLEEAGRSECEPEEMAKKILAERLNVNLRDSREGSIKERVISIFKSREGTMTLEDILSVVLKMKDGKDYIGAVRERASERKVDYNTIADKCTRRIRLTTHEFKKKVIDNFLIN